MAKRKRVSRRWCIMGKEAGDKRFRNIGEGPFSSKARAENFASAEVGIPYIVKACPAKRKKG